MTTLCCTDCFSIEEIQNFIVSFQTIGDCNYCSSCNIHIADVDEVGSFIRDGFDRYYEDAANSVGYCSAEGGYLFPTSYIDEILKDEEQIFSDHIDDPISLLENLVSDDGTPYVRQHPYSEPSGQPDEITHWQKFCEIVKNKQRYTALLTTDEDKMSDHTSPNFFFYRLSSHFMPSLIKILEPNKTIYRARINNSQQQFKHSDLTSPPAYLARNGRMNPNGISYFYGTQDIDTCIHEVRPEIGEEVVVAKFKTLCELTVLDLSQTIESRLSIFNEDYCLTHEEFFKPFLKYFTETIARPIRRSDNELEYVPTQVFTEYIKTINFKKYLSATNDEDSDVYLDGLIFRSSTNSQGVNVVLFKDSSISTTKHKKEKGAWLEYKSKKSYSISGVNIAFE